MPKKCESCRYYVNPERAFEFDGAICSNIEINSTVRFQRVVMMPEARELCDREGDGHFIYFEPKEPAAGQAFAKAA